MPEDAQTTLQGLLGTLEGLQNSQDDALYSNKSHLNLLKSLNSLLNSGDDITSEEADRVLRMCLRYKLDMRCAPYVLSIIASLINIDKVKSFAQYLDFLPSALAILDFLKQKCAEDKTNHLRILAFQVLMSHPDMALVNLVSYHSPLLIETFGLFLSMDSGGTLGAKSDSFILLRLLEQLPDHVMQIFVKEGIPLWLSGVIPTLVKILISLEDVEKSKVHLRHVELLTAQLVLHDYFEYPEWQNFLESVVDPNKFPVCIKSLLEKGKDTWHRIWIVIIKLLKGYVTRSVGSYGTPINSMLPVVETAFKRDSTQRVRAFMCWNELIVHFSAETNPNCIAKRLKLVIIPLRLNNAKSEDAASAKLNTWWLVIRKFKTKLEKHTNEVLIPFLYFLFGKENASKPTFWASQLCHQMRRKCLSAFVEIVGHSECPDRCTSVVEPLYGKIITTVMLADHWNDWVYFLKSAIKIVAMNYTSNNKMIIRCIWKSFVLLMTELLDNSLRRDWFNDLINLLSVLFQDCSVYDELLEILIDDLMLPLFRDSRVKTLISTRSEDHRPMHKIVILIVDKTFDKFYKRHNFEDLMKMLEPLVWMVINESVEVPARMIWLLDELPATDNSLKLWTALMRAASESNLCLQAINALLRWPFKMMHAFVDVKQAALAWYTLYNVVHVKLDKIGFDNEISKFLIKPVEESKSANYFILFALIGVLKYKTDEDKLAKLEALTYEMKDYLEFEPLIPSLADTLVLMIYNLSTIMNENVAQITINCVNNVLKLIHSEIDTSVNSNSSSSRETAFSEVRVNVPTINRTVLSDTIISAMKVYLAKCPNESIKKEIRNVISSIDKDVKSLGSPKKTHVVAKEFVSPKVQEVKKSKKKEPSIVNTVVENGEEYVVVKSNWKFNPKKLTENQKEKFQKQREIPALYQDLSQSQDEFKLATWKTNSQDTSLSSSKSTSNNDASEILKNMPSTDIVPTIMENILENTKNHIQKNNDNTLPVSKEKLVKVDKVATPTGTKSPRMALKDRVFRNVRNLIENSSMPPTSLPENLPKSPKLDLRAQTTGMKDDISINENIPKSPLPKPSHNTDIQPNQTPVLTNVDKNSTSNINKIIIVTAKQDTKNITLICTPIPKLIKNDDVVKTTPLLSSAERPARMKRTPKKFDDSLLIAFKKRRHSIDLSQTNPQEVHDIQPEVTVAQVHTPKNNNIHTPIEHGLIEASKSATSEQIIMNCDVLKDKNNMESHIIEKNTLITPTTPIIGEEAEKSPEKPSNTVEVPRDEDKASKGFENDNAVIVKKVSARRNSSQRDAHKMDNQLDAMTTPLKKVRKAKVRNENESIPLDNKERILTVDYIKNDNKEVEPLSTPKQKVEKRNSSKSVIKSVAQIDTNENDKNSELVKTSFPKGKEVNQVNSATKNKELQRVENNIKEDIEMSDTPKNQTKNIALKSSVKKTKKSRIEKELMIDMVEGHPFLTAHSEKRATRKKIMEMTNSNRRKSMLEKLNKSKLEATPKAAKKPKQKKTVLKESTVTVESESQDKKGSSTDDAIIDEPPCSEDIIESSQDSTITTMSTISTKRTPARHPIVSLNKLITETTQTQDLINDSEIIDIHDQENREKTDIELTQNKTAEMHKNTTDLTEEMDTEPMIDNNTDDVIILDDTETSPGVTKSDTVIGPETQELAEADTQPNDPYTFKELESFEVLSSTQPPITKEPETVNTKEATLEKEIVDITISLPETSIRNIDETSELSSPFKDENLRKQDFLNNTLEISPIKIQSPDREKKSPSPETSSDFVVIKLSSPVHSNGEPFDKHGSPEFFTEDKISPEKRDASPPRIQVTATDTSPSSSLSLKKNRPQGRPSGRAAQMLDLLCVSSDLKVTKVSERTDNEEVKKAGTSTPVRRNLRILYNSVGDCNENMPESSSEDTENFLKLKRNLPTVTSSPSGPILKRKLIDIADEATASPASKRKRVSFHDPPVSTTISVHKYIEPLSLVRSPQSSAKKRFERQTRLGIKSPKRLENDFNLDSVLSKTVESFIGTSTPTDDTQNISLDITPVVEIVKTSDLNDTDPLYPDLIDCKDPIDAIATELSSPAMRELLVKELEGKVETIGDLAKMTELEVHRLCIKAPKIKTAKKVLADYACKRSAVELVETVIEDAFRDPMTESLLNKSEMANVEIQTREIEVSSVEMQTIAVPSILASTQTESVSAAHTSIQTDESGSKTTAEIISTCLVEREDFLQNLSEQLDDGSIKTIAQKLPTKLLFDLLIKNSDNPITLLNRLLKHQSKGIPKEKKSSAELSFVRDRLCERYESSDLVLLCSQILQNIHDKSV